MSNISVIIRNKNEKDYIGFAIQSVVDNFIDPEIIVVDNNSTDESLDIVNLFKPQRNIKIVNINSYSPGASLNMGVKHCSNNTILILSAHSQITISPNLGIINSYLNDYVAVFGKQIPIYKGKKITPRYIWSHFTESNEVNMFSTIENRPFLHNAFCFYSKSTLEKYPFDETLPGKEDRYWATDVIKKGFNYLYTPELEVNHYWTPNGATWKGIG
jgi:glycosyltransferase involved in cell wall biosynthesis